MVVDVVTYVEAVAEVEIAVEQFIHRELHRGRLITQEVIRGVTLSVQAGEGEIMLQVVRVGLWVEEVAEEVEGGDSL